MTVRSFRYAVTIEGVPTAFAEPGFPSAQLTDWADVLYTLHDLNESETTLDLESRRMLGASFSFKMWEDDAGTLRALCKARQNPVAWLVESSIPANNTAIPLVEVSGTPSDIPNPFYMGAETLSYNGTSGSDIANVSRALYDSSPQKHYGDANDGSATEIFSAPRRWTGRKVTVWESQLDETGTFGAKMSIGVARLADAPAFNGSDTWSFESTNLAEWIAGRPLVQGLQPVFPADAEAGGDLATTVTLDAESVKKLWNGQSFDGARVLWTLDNGEQWLMPIESSTSTTVTVDFDKIEKPLRAPLKFDENGLPVSQTYVWTEAQPVFYWEGDPVDITLALLVSKLGDSALGTWDVLPGLEPTEFGGVQFQTGAGIDQTEIVVDAFKEMRGGPGWRAVLKDRWTVGDLLAEFCQTLGAYWYTDTSGRVTVQRLTERLPPSSSAASITDALWGVGSADSIGATERTVHHTVKWMGNWDPFQEVHRVTVNVVDAKARNEAPFDDRVLGLETRFVSTDAAQWGVVDRSEYQPANPIGRVDLETALRRIQQYSKRAASEIVVEVPITTATASVVPGVVVDVTNIRIPDLLGSTLDTSLALCLGAQRNFETASFSLRLRLLDNGYLFAPAAEVSSVGGGGSTVTLSTTTDYGTATPTNQFAVGWEIENQDQTWSATIATIISTAVLTVSGATGTLTAGDVIMPKMDGTLSSVDNADGYDMNDFLAQVNAAGTSPTGALTRWS